ncbi:MAG: hypothetical protein K9N51_10020 [Candidatus Pacebacteria bacterium]|nr:hypothetical protein [Candidatus Paceibacterota bacterium]
MKSKFQKTLAALSLIAAFIVVFETEALARGRRGCCRVVQPPPDEEPNDEPDGISR